MARWQNSKKFYTVTIHISNEAREKLNVQCRKILVDHHPELKDAPLSLGFIAEHCFDYYIQS